MIKKNQELFNRLNILSDGVIAVAAFVLAYYIRFYVLLDGKQSLPRSVYWYTALSAALALILAYGAIGVYQPQRKRRLRKLCLNIIVTNILLFSMLLAALFLLKLDHFSRLVLLLYFFFETGGICGKHILMRFLMRQLRRKGYNQKHVILVGSGKLMKRCLSELRASPELGIQVVGYVSEKERMEGLPCLGRPKDLLQILETVQPDEVIAGLEQDEACDVTTLVYICDAAGVRFSLVPTYAGLRAASPQLDRINDIPLLTLRRVPLDYFGNAALKRAMDLIGAILMLILLCPLMLAIAIGVKLSSPGPVLFRQVRIGCAREPFTMYKFRSMQVNGSENSGWTTKSDPRRTAFGAFLRKWSLDELPQLFNVLKGDMSLVGPRPELPFFVERFREDVPLYMIKHLVRPGMTGLAQVRGLRGDTSIEKRIEMDIHYIENWSVWLDIKILFLTLGHIKNDELIPC